MNSKLTSYYEIHPIQLNVYLLFYLYIFVVVIIANILPASSVSYFLFLFLGISGTSFLLVKFQYGILIRNNSLEIFIKIPFKITLQKLRTENITDIEKARIDHSLFQKVDSKKPAKYIFKKKDGIKLTMSDGKILFISGVDADQIIERMNFN